ncbi:MAG: hypothetical protein M3Y56_09895 [Armatimonadota bacterium]|nr:hypothetical protein [Armatimonadota bacterium]
MEARRTPHKIRWRRLSLLCIVVVCILLVLGFVAGFLPVPIRRLHTNFDRWGTEIWMMGTSGFAGHWRGRLVMGGFTTIGPLKELNDLRGAVQLRTVGDALEFVRLRTSPSTWDCWDESEAEIVTTDEAIKLPTFGLHRAPGPPFRAGFLGVLLPKVFRLGGFTPAKVEILSKGFRVTRWIYCDRSQSHPYETVQKVQEFVGEDGSYRRVILQEKEPPKLPDVYWEFMTYE